MARGLGGSKTSFGIEQAPTTENLDIATYREATVSVKNLNRTSLLLSRADHMELKIVSGPRSRCTALFKP